MKEKKHISGIQLDLFGMSADENHFTSTKWGVLTFFAARTNKWVDTCRHCLLWDNIKKACSEPPLTARCASYERIDKREGYFSIQQMPIG